MEDEKKITKDGFEYTFEKRGGTCLCTNCIIQGNGECRENGSIVRDACIERGDEYICIKKEKIEAYKPGMKVVITEEGVRHPKNNTGCGWHTPSRLFYPGCVLTLTGYKGSKVNWETEENKGFCYNEAWFKPYTEKENKDMIETTKYELVKELTGKSIAATACSGEFEKFVKLCGYHTSVVWDLEFEKYAMEQNGWITFLEDNGFISEPEPKETDRMIIFFVSSFGDIYKLHESFCNEGGFQWCSVRNSCGGANSMNDTFASAISYAKKQGHIVSFSDEKSAYKFLISKL